MLRLNTLSAIRDRAETRTKDQGRCSVCILRAEGNECHQPPNYQPNLTTFLWRLNHLPLLLHPSHPHNAGLFSVFSADKCDSPSETSIQRFISLSLYVCESVLSRGDFVWFSFGCIDIINNNIAFNDWSIQN